MFDELIIQISYSYVLLSSHVQNCNLIAADIWCNNNIIITSFVCWVFDQIQNKTKKDFHKISKLGHYKKIITKEDHNYAHAMTA